MLTNLESSGQIKQWQQIAAKLEIQKPFEKEWLAIELDASNIRDASGIKAFAESNSLGSDKLRGDLEGLVTNWLGFNKTLDQILSSPNENQALIDFVHSNDWKYPEKVQELKNNLSPEQVKLLDDLYNYVDRIEVTKEQAKQDWFYIRTGENPISLELDKDYESPEVQPSPDPNQKKIIISM